MEPYFVGGCHDFLEQTTPENRQKINNLLQRYKECVVEYGDDFDIGIEIDLAEIELTDKELKVVKKQKYRHEDRRELQKLRKEWEDR